MQHFCHVVKNAPKDKYLLLETRNYWRNFHLLSLCLLRPLSCRFTLPLFLFLFLKKNWQLFTSSDKSWQGHAEWAAVGEAGHRSASFSQSTLRLAVTKHYSHFVQQRNWLHAHQQQTLESGRNACVWKHAKDVQWTKTPVSTHAIFIVCILHVVLSSTYWIDVAQKYCSSAETTFTLTLPFFPHAQYFWPFKSGGL